MKSFWLPSAVAGLVLFSNAHGADSPPETTSQLFQFGKLWPVSLRFTEDQWKGIEPKQTGEDMFGGGGPRGEGRGPGGPGGGRGGRGGFGPGNFMAPTIVQALDADKNAELTRQEMVTGFERWFTSWNPDPSKELTLDQFKDGLTKELQMGPGGGRGGRGGGMNLQGRAGSRNGLSAARGIEFAYVHGDFEIAGRTYKDVAVRYKGNGTYMGSQFSDKRSFKIDLNEFKKDQKLGSTTKVNLHNGVTDASMMNEVMAHRLYRDAGVPAPRTSYALVKVNVPGKFDDKTLGVYSVVENIDAAFAEYHFGTRKGVILKPVTPQPFTDLGDKWEEYKQTYDPKTEMSPKEIQRVMSFCKLVSNGSDAEFAAQVGNYLDLENFSRFMAVTVWLSTLDSILSVGQNYVVHLHPKTGKFQFIPWDLDHSFGQFGMMGTQEQREELDIRHPWMGNIRFMERVFAVPAFKDRYLAVMKEFSGTLFRPERFNRQVDELAAILESAIKEESEAKHVRFAKAVKGEELEPSFGPPPGEGNERRERRDQRPPGEGERPGPGRGGGGGGGGPRGMGTIKPIKAFVPVRSQSVEAQLAGREGKRVGNGFGAGMFLGDPLMERGDTDKNGKLSRTEFLNLGGGWFDSWDTNKLGKLNEEQIRMAMNAAMPGPGGAGGPGGFRGGGPGGGRGFGGPDGGRGRGGFGPAMFLAPALMSQGDADKDGKLTRPEFVALGEKWFAGWDSGKTGSVTEDQLKTGLGVSLPPLPGFPAPPAGFGPGNFLGRPFMAGLDADKDGKITKAEASTGFGAWFDKWKGGDATSLNEETLRTGINADLALPPGGPPGF